MDEDQTLIFSKRIERAAELVVKAHEGQTRKDGVTPYYKHPFAVAKLVQESLHIDPNSKGEVIIISALAHDCVEDVPEFDLDEFVESLYYNEQGYEKDKQDIKTVVLALTKNNSVGNRHKRDLDSYDRILNCDKAGTAAIIKLCDRYHNISDMDGMTEAFKMRYIAETYFMLGIFERFYSDYKIYEDLLKLTEKKLSQMSKKLG